MSILELKIPPVAVVGLFALSMWGVAEWMPSLTFILPWSRGIAIGLGLAGAAVSLAGVAAFRSAQTTVDPTHPDAASSVVTSGIYGLAGTPCTWDFSSCSPAGRCISPTSLLSPCCPAS